MIAKLIRYLAPVIVIMTMSGCDESVWQCGTGEKADNGVCVPKTCETDGYECPTCNAPWEELFYNADESGYCKITSCPDGEKVVEINATAAECVALTCRDDGYECPSCYSYEKLTYNADGSGVCVTQNCRDDHYGCPTCTAYETLGYRVDGSGVCVSKPCQLPSVGSSYALNNIVIPMCKVQLANGQWINVDLGIGNGASTDAGKSYLLTDNGLALNCADHNGVCPGSGTIFPLTQSQFSPAILEFEFNEATNRARVTGVTRLQANASSTISPLFHPLMDTNSSQKAYDRNGNEISYNANAMDPEAVVKLSSGRGYWIAEEYTASIAHLSESGLVTKRYVPQGWYFATTYDVNDSLPSELTQRQAHHGIKALAVDELAGEIYFMTDAALNGDPANTLRLYSASFTNSNLNELDISTINNDHNYTVDNGFYVTEMHRFDTNKLLVVEDSGSATRVYGVVLSGVNLVKHAIDTSAVSMPIKVQGLSEAPMGGADRYFFINDNDFGQNGHVNEIRFIDLNTSGV